MRSIRSRMALLFATTAMIGTAAIARLAGPEGSLDLSWHTIDAGGGTMAGGSLQLSATIGQPDAGAMSGGTIELAGGFWFAAGGVTPVCPADIANRDGMVNIDDLLMVINAWGNPGGPADVDNSGTVNIDDLLLIINGWGMCP